MKAESMGSGPPGILRALIGFSCSTDGTFLALQMRGSEVFSQKPRSKGDARAIRKEAEEFREEEIE